MVKFVNTSKGQFTILYLPLKTNKQKKTHNTTFSSSLLLLQYNSEGIDLYSYGFV